MSETLDLHLLKYLKESGFLFAAIFIGILLFRMFNVFYRLIYFQIILAVLSYIAAYAIPMYQASHGMSLTNHWMYNVYILLEVPILLAAAYVYVSKPFQKKLILIGVMVFLSTYVTEAAYDGLWQILNLTMVASGFILVITYSGIIYISLRHIEFSWRGSPDIWLSTGILLYFACNVPFMGLFEQLLMYDEVLVDKLFYITEVLASVRYLTVCVAFLMLKKQMALRNSV